MMTLLRPIATNSFKKLRIESQSLSSTEYPVGLLPGVLNKITTFVCLAANSLTRCWNASWLKLLCSSNKEYVTSVRPLSLQIMRYAPQYQSAVNTSSPGSV